MSEELLATVEELRTRLRAFVGEADAERMALRAELDHAVLQARRFQAEAAASTEALAPTRAELARVRRRQAIIDPWRGTAPSGLPFWLGCFKGNDEVAALLEGTYFGRGVP